MESNKNLGPASSCPSLLSQPSITPRKAIPASFFGIVVGTLALSTVWLIAEKIWFHTAIMSTALAVFGVSLWTFLVIRYALKWILQRSAAITEINHPLQSNLAALGPVSTMLVSMAVLKWSTEIAMTILVLGLLWQFILSLHVHGRFWQGGKNHAQITPAVYLPTVAQNLVASMAVSTFGWHQLGMLYLGTGIFSWLALESIVLTRAGLHPEFLHEERPLMGIQIAPAAVTGVALGYSSLGFAENLSMLLFGYALFQFLLMLRLFPWIAMQKFAPTYWSFAFGIVALANIALRQFESSRSEFMSALSIGLFSIANLMFVVLFGGTLSLLVRGRLLPHSVTN